VKRAVALFVPLAASLAWAQPEKPNPHLAQAIAFYESLEFEHCLQRIDEAERWPSSTAERVKIELYAGLCQHSLRREGLARARFARAVALDPNVELPPFSSPKTVALFAEVKAEWDHPDAGTPAVTPAPVEVGTTEVSSARRPPWAGVLLTAVAAGAGAGGVLFGLQAKRLEAASDTRFESDSAALGASARNAALFANLSYAVAVVAALGAVLAFWWGLKP
jgi:hypothetical protein